MKFIRASYLEKSRILALHTDVLGEDGYERSLSMRAISKDIANKNKVVESLCPDIKMESVHG